VEREKKVGFVAFIERYFFSEISFIFLEFVEETVLIRKIVQFLGFEKLY
jgi:hypothetical protein